MYVFKAGVVGAGAMGAEIAQAITWSGLPVILKDVDQAFLDKGMARIKAIYQRRVNSGRMSQADADGKVALVTPTLSYEAFKDVDLVIEAVPEKLDLKKRVFADLDAALPSMSIIASNTSALSITAMAEATRRPAKVVGLHFFYPAAVMKLVEVIACKYTDEDTMDTAVEFVEGLRKLPVRVKECPGFLVNRILMAAMNQAILFAEETNLPKAEIDAVLKEKTGLPMGPFTLSDSLGLDIALDVAQTLEVLGPRFAPPQSLVDLVKQGKLGAKTGEGFYTYTR